MPKKNYTAQKRQENKEKIKVRMSIFCKPGV